MSILGSRVDQQRLRLRERQALGVRGQFAGRGFARLGLELDGMALREDQCRGRRQLRRVVELARVAIGGVRRFDTAPHLVRRDPRVVVRRRVGDEPQRLAIRFNRGLIVFQQLMDLGFFKARTDAFGRIKVRTASSTELLERGSQVDGFLRVRRPQRSGPAVSQPRQVLSLTPQFDVGRIVNLCQAEQLACVLEILNGLCRGGHVTSLFRQLFALSQQETAPEQ